MNLLNYHPVVFMFIFSSSKHLYLKHPCISDKKNIKRTNYSTINSGKRYFLNIPTGPG